MHISTIEDFMWPEIIGLQRQAYIHLLPESEIVLKSKWQSAPETCFVCRMENKVVAYLLAHGWSGEILPKLHQVMVGPLDSERLLIHDLVVSPQQAGHGIGSRLVLHTIETAREHRYRQATLVAVQGASPFWAKMGFVKDLSLQVSSDYGADAVAMSKSLAS